MFRPLLATVLCSALLPLAHAESTLNLNLSPAQRLTTLPSGSGLALVQKQLYAVGDDVPWRYALDAGLQVSERVQLQEFPLEANGRIPKKLKPDYEAMASLEIDGKPWLVVLGSGSKPQVREHGILVTADGEQLQVRDLAPLYKELYRLGGFSGEETLNVEGLAFAEGQAYIFNRGNGGHNLIFRLAQADLVAYLKGSDATGNIDLIKVKLPVIEKFEAGLSGGDYWPAANSLVYTASVEATGDAYNDGAILGSFVGLIPLAELTPGSTLDLSARSVLLKDGDKPLITKLESVAVDALSTAGQANGVLISDNDDGSSELFRFQLARQQ